MKDLTFNTFLRCPISQKPLRALSQGELISLNQRIDRDEIFHADGSKISKTWVAGLKVEDEDIFYPIEDDIIYLLPHFACVSEFNPKYKIKADLNEVKTQLQSFYDDTGWQQENEGHFVDAKDSEDLRKVSHAYIKACHMRVKRHLKGGKFLLDVASGPIQYPEYMSYSESYRYRICADISVAGLKAAKAKLKDKGVYLLCDIANLPIQTDCIDSVVSMHTIYHIPKEEQSTAFSELYRVLKPKGTSVVVYSWGNRSLLMNVALFPFKALRLCKSKLLQVRKKGNQPSIYFYAHGFSWYAREIQSRYPTTIEPWRSVNVPFMKIFVHPFLLGKQLLKICFKLEEKFPKLMARIGAYPMILMEKK